MNKYLNVVHVRIILAVAIKSTPLVLGAMITD